jgi:hypothetical protein
MGFNLSWIAEVRHYVIGCLQGLSESKYCQLMHTSTYANLHFRLEALQSVTTLTDRLYLAIFRPASWIEFTADVRFVLSIGMWPYLWITETRSAVCMPTVLQQPTILTAMLPQRLEQGRTTDCVWKCTSTLRGRKPAAQVDLHNSNQCECTSVAHVPMFDACEYINIAAWSSRMFSLPTDLTWEVVSAFTCSCGCVWIP